MCLAVSTMDDLDALALAMPEATKEVTDDGRPVYLVHGKFFCSHRERRSTRSIPKRANAWTTC